jgi:hypothetical protein
LQMTMAAIPGAYPSIVFRVPPQFEDPSGRSSKSTIPRVEEFA